MHARLASLLALGVLAMSCGSTRAPQSIRQGPFALPAGGDARYLTFSDAGFGFAGEDLIETTPPGAGAARGASIDTRLGEAVVVYEHRLAVVDLSSSTAEWLPLELPSPSVHVAAYDGFATITSGTWVEVFDLQRSESVVRRDLTSWLSDVGLRVLEAASPVGPGELVLVASNGGHDGEVTLQKVDIGSGAWRMSTRSELRALTRVDDVVVDGTGMILAGVLERLQPGVGNNAGRLWQTLIVERADLETLQTWEVVYQERQQRDTMVVQVVAGRGLIAVLLDSGKVAAYRLNERGSTSSPIYDQGFVDARSIAWVGDDELVVVTGTGSRVLRMSDR